MEKVTDFFTNEKLNLLRKHIFEILVILLIFSTWHFNDKFTHHLEVDNEKYIEVIKENNQLLKTFANH